MKKGDKIIFFVSSLDKAGGIEKITTIISSSLASRGIKVVLLSICSKKSFFDTSADVRIESLCDKKSPFVLFVVVYQLFRFLRREKPNYFVCVGASLVLYSVLPILIYNVKYILWEHFSWKYKWNKLTTGLSRWIAIKKCDQIITLNEDDFNYYHSKLAKKVIVIPNPAPKLPSISTSQRVNILLSVGRLVNVKGYDLLLKSWSDVIDKAGWSLYIVGDGEMKDNLENLIDLYKIRDCTKIFPATNKISDFYKVASIYILSSRSECFPMVLLEAESYGLPVISFDCGAGVRSLVHNKVNGFLVPLEDTILMSKKISDLIHNENLRCNLGNKSLDVVKDFSIEKITDLWLKEV